jgi:hypothetical protein
MKSHTPILTICAVTLLVPMLQSEYADDRPALNEPQSKLIKAIESIASENVAVARVNVAHDVAHKTLRIFTLVPHLDTEELKVSDYNVEIIYNYDVACANNGASSYRFQNNDEVLAFAAAEFVSGNKAFAKELVEILGEAEPDLFWSSPTHPIMTIKQITGGLQNDDETIKEFLSDESEWWAQTLKKYGPHR